MKFIELILNFLIHKSFEGSSHGIDIKHRIWWNRIQSLWMVTAVKWDYDYVVTNRVTAVAADIDAFSTLQWLNNIENQMHSIPPSKV